MPSVKFLNLEEKKKREIMDAAKSEFSCKKYEDASINKMIKDISMPRGTFYLYFENKQDLYLYLLEEFIKDFKQQFVKILNECDGDIFDALVVFYDDIIGSTDYNSGFIANLFMNMNSRQLDIAVPQFMKKEKDGFVMANMNITHYSMEDHEKDLLLSILMPILFHTVAHTLDYPNKKEKIKEHYMNQLNMIKRGLERK